MESNNEIIVAWGIDKNYILQSFVVMHSILKHSDACFRFYLLSGDDLKDDVTLLESRLKRKYNNFSVYFLQIKDHFFDNIEIRNEHLSKAAFNRLFAAEMLSEYDKCIYVDCDVIVNGDLCELWDIDVGNSYIWGVKDCHIIADNEFEKKHQEYLGIPTRERYINSGVLLMNLRRLREDRMLEAFMTRAKEKNLFEDQDVLNVCCYDAIGILPLKYNLFHFYLGENIKRLFELPYEKNEFEFDWDCPFIVHMGGKYKPWVYKNIKYADVWWRLAEIFKDTVFYKELYREMEENFRVPRSIGEITKYCAAKKDIVLWGGSANGKIICDVLRQNGVNGITAIYDNYIKNSKEVYKGIEVRQWTGRQEYHQDTIWVITCQKEQSYKAVCGQLWDAGVQESATVRCDFLYRDSFYYMLLDPKYYAEELENIAVFEFAGIIPEWEKRKICIKDIVNHPEKYPQEYRYLSQFYYFNLWINNKRKCE